MKKIIAIIAVKKNSIRLKNKNLLLINKQPLFWHSIKCFYDVLKTQDIYIATDSQKILAFCKKKKINVIWRGPNKTIDEEQLFEVLKYSYGTLKFKTKYVLSVLANSPFHTKQNVENLIKQIKKDKFDEVRSFDKHGQETGLFAFKSKIFHTRYEISNHIGAIPASAKEIHYKKEFLKLKNLINKQN